MPLDGLDGQAVAVTADGSVHIRHSDRARDHSALLLCRQESNGAMWVLVSAGKAGVRINGMPVFMGIRVLQDQDEICVAGERVFFSTERLAHVDAFPGDESPIFCPRCKQLIPRGSPVVRCPQCQVFHHQSEELPCWTYSNTCALCGQSTTLDASYRFTPEDL